jgi:RHS repeat-associated protein
LNRLTSATTPDESFAYDAVGNRTDDGQQYDPNNRLLQDGQYTYTSDANGNVTSRTSKKTGESVDYAWNAEDQLTAVTIKRDGINASSLITYVYDGQGRRVSRSMSDLVDPSKSYIRKYLYDGQDILEEIDGNGKTVAAYLHGPGVDEPLVMLQDVNGSGTFESEAETFFYTRDQLGSIRDLTGTSGVLQQRYRYSAYGVTTIERDQGSGTEQKLIENPFAYTGGELEQETGDYFYRARYYSALSGRFLSRDPIGFEGGDVNLYTYVGNNPVSFVDPYGLYKFAPGAHGPLTSGLDSALQCFEACAGQEVTVTSGQRGGSGPHGSGNACDPGRRANPWLSPDTARNCYQSCFNVNQSYAQEERNNPDIGGTHYHFQNQPGRGGANNFSPYVRPYQP